MDKYNCEICGKKHAIYTSLEIPFPRIISEIEEKERDNRVKEIDGFYIVDDTLLFANGWVNIEVEGKEFPFFYWKTWTSISKEKFMDNLEELNSGNVIEFDGKLEEDLPFYLNSIDLKSKTLIQAANEGMIVEILIQEESKLKEDQSKPISEKRMIEIMQMIHHHPKREKSVNLDKTFRVRLLEELEKTQGYLKSDKNFAINIGTGTTLFQIVSNEMLETKRYRELGFGLHLSFDDSFDEMNEEISKFRSKEYSKRFDFYNLDDIPTYQIDLGTNIDELVVLVQSILIEVYGENIEMIEMDSFEI